MARSGTTAVRTIGLVRVVARYLHYGCVFRRPRLALCCGGAGAVDVQGNVRKIPLDLRYRASEMATNLLRVCIVLLRSDCHTFSSVPDPTIGFASVHSGPSFAHLYTHSSGSYDLQTQSATTERARIDVASRLNTTLFEKTRYLGLV